MTLYFHAQLTKLRMTYHDFFRMAYVWKFGQLKDLEADCGDYQNTGRLPPYVIAYLRHLKEK